MSKPFALPVGSRSILACRDTFAAGLRTRIAGLYPVEDVSAYAAPHGVSVMDLEALPQIVAPVRASDIDDLHRTAVGNAWQDGAWDLQCTVWPPLAGGELGLVTAFTDFDLDPGLRDILIEAAQRGRLATWLWRPMREAPVIRIKAWQAKDTTLEDDGGRSSDPPDNLRRPDWAWRKGRSWTIRLGRGLPVGPRPRAATPRQRNCIVALQLAAGGRVDVPARLSFVTASAMIDDLKRTTR